MVMADIARLKARRAAELLRIVSALRAHDDLARRLDLVLSVPGLGERTALALIVRMPELGRVSREQAAALAGLAPFDDDSGKHKGERHIAGGRRRLRRSLFAAAPTTWSATLEFLRQRAIAGIEYVTANSYARSVKLDGVQGTVAVEPADGNALRATVRFPKLSALPAIIARLRRVFDLAADPFAIAAHLTRDPTLSPLVKARPGLRVPGAWDGFELAIRAVLGQQITVTAAARLAGRLVAAHGERLQTADENLTHVFPEPKSLASADLSKSRHAAQPRGGAVGGCRRRDRRPSIVRSKLRA